MCKEGEAKRQGVLPAKELARAPPSGKCDDTSRQRSFGNKKKPGRDREICLLLNSERRCAENPPRMPCSGSSPTKLFPTCIPAPSQRGDDPERDINQAAYTP